MSSSNLHTRAHSVTPPNHATIRFHRRQPGDCDTVDTDTPPPAVALAGEYELVKQLGRGGMGVVYLARQRGLKRYVAYKVLTQCGSLDPETLDRFRGEAETLAKLQHTGIVQVYDSGSSNGSPYLAMEYVAGGSLADRARIGRLEPRAAAVIIATVAGAVGHAHAHGIIHRDLKPANILLTVDGSPKVADFGLARDLANAGLTRSGFIAGTPSYMAPEQLSGRRDLGPTVDVWALGVMLYELLAGTVPFAGDDPGQILANVLRHEPVALRRWQPHLPRDLETICLKCLRKEPHRRYASGSELADDLLRFLDGQSILARPVGRAEKAVRWARRNPLAAGLAAASATILLAATAVSLAFARQANQSWHTAEDNAARAVRAMMAEQKLREDAERSAAAEKLAREQAERAVAAEKKAREKTENLTEMLDELLQGIRPSERPLDALIEQMKGTVQRLEKHDGDTLVRARLFRTLGLTHRNLGSFAASVPLYERHYELLRTHHGPRHPATLDAASDLSYTYYHVHRNEDAIRTLAPALEVELATATEDSPRAFGLLSQMYMYYASAGRLVDEAKLGQRLLAIRVKQFGPDHELTEWTRVNLRKYQPSHANLQESIPVLRKAYARMLGYWGPHEETTKWTRLTLGLSLLRNGQAREALPYMETNYNTALSEKGYHHDHSLYAARFLAECYEGCGRWDDAAPIRKRMFEHYRSKGDAANAAEQERLLNADLTAAKE
jgi:eukaryotic-like serine/threonine-protein kinase